MREGTEDVPVLNPTRLLAGRERENGGDFAAMMDVMFEHTPDICWRETAVSLLQNEPPHPTTSGQMAGAQARPVSRDAHVPPDLEAGRPRKDQQGSGGKLFWIICRSLKSGNQFCRRV